MKKEFIYNSINKVAKASWIIPLSILPFIILSRATGSINLLLSINIITFVINIIGIVLGVIAIWIVTHYKKHKNITYQASFGILLNASILSFFQLFWIFYWTLILPPYTEELKAGKYMLSAPAMSRHKSNYIQEWYSDLRQLKNGAYRLTITELGKSGEIKFKITKSGVIAIIDSRHLEFGYAQADARGFGKLIGEGIAKGEVVCYYTSIAIFNMSRSTSGWFLRPATRNEINENLKKGLEVVTLLLSQKGKRQNKENIIKALGAGVGSGFSGSDIPQIKEMIKSGAIEYKDDKFVIHKDLKPEEKSVKPDISPKFYRIYLLPFAGLILILTIIFIMFFRKKRNSQP